MNTPITRWNPLKELHRLQNRLDSLWNSGPFQAPDNKNETLAASEWSPRVDIVEDEKEFLVRAELPGMKREDVKVSVQDGVLTLSGERRMEKDETHRHYHRVESEHGSFVRSFTLPASVSSTKVAAEFKDGLLKVHLPKDTKTATKSVEIKVS